MMGLGILDAPESAIDQLPAPAFARARTAIVFPTFEPAGKSHGLAGEGCQRFGEVLAHQQLPAGGHESLREAIGCERRSGQKGDDKGEAMRLEF